MGADLYINSITRECNEKYYPFFEAAVNKRNQLSALGMEDQMAIAQEEVLRYNDLMNSEGYFRDSYNGTALMAFLYLDNSQALSWWVDIAPLQNSKGDIKGKNLEKFLTIILAAELRLPTKEVLVARGCRVDEAGEDSVEGWQVYLTNKREKLVSLIVQAMEIGEPVHASL